MRRTATLPAIVVFACVLVAGCLPRERLDSNCSWRGDSAFAVDLRNRTEAAHLQLDVTLADEIGMRYGDQFRRRIPIAQTRRLGDECTDSLFGVVERLHNVDPSAVLSLRGRRDPWIDFATIYLPMIVLFALAADPIARRVGSNFDVEDEWARIVALIAIALLVAGAGVLLAQLWSTTVEAWRLRDGHLSYRTNRLPIGNHALLAWLTGVVLFLGVAALRYPKIIAAARARPIGAARPRWATADRASVSGRAE